MGVPLFYLWRCSLCRIFCIFVFSVVFGVFVGVSVGLSIVHVCGVCIGILRVYVCVLWQCGHCVGIVFW